MRCALAALLTLLCNFVMWPLLAMLFGVCHQRDVLQHAGRAAPPASAILCHLAGALSRACLLLYDVLLICGPGMLLKHCCAEQVLPALLQRSPCVVLVPTLTCLCGCTSQSAQSSRN
jgi:hypothetical protein